MNLWIYMFGMSDVVFCFVLMKYRVSSRIRLMNMVYGNSLWMGMGVGMIVGFSIVLFMDVF